jgi:hypothetical protein
MKYSATFHCGSAVTLVQKWERLCAVYPQGLFIEGGGYNDVFSKQREHGRGAVTPGTGLVSVHKSAPTVGTTFEIQISHNPIITSNIARITKVRFGDILNKYFS